MSTWVTSIFVVALISMAAGFVGALARFSERISVIREKKRHAEQSDEIRDLLKKAGYNIYAVNSSVDIEAKRLTISTNSSSKTFEIDQARDNLWRIYVYNHDGARRVMSPETFEMELLQVRDSNKRLIQEAGFDSGRTEHSTIAERPA